MAAFLVRTETGSEGPSKDEGHDDDGDHHHCDQPYHGWPRDGYGIQYCFCPGFGPPHDGYKCDDGHKYYGPGGLKSYDGDKLYGPEAKTGAYGNTCKKGDAGPADKSP
ncbi:hypothetical protein CJ030_MR5G010387 [Morella rubra]|uniref:Uncharacterized protein n=1 Tax=Morella rubra TaxID=262757 RepID=A0A6A1VRC8_9ROSI|nr:hypothetical protein CJ030_MR5G010387 [Morella rubra]